MPQVIRPKIMPGCPSQVVNCTLSCESDCGGPTELSRTHCSPKHTSVATTSEGGDGGEQVLGSGGKKKRKRTKGPSRRAKDELRRARFLVDKACRELGENGPGSRVTVTGPTALADADCRIVSCDAATTPECHCTVDCFADDTGHDPWFGWYPGYPMDDEAQPGTLRLALAPRPASERSHLGAASRVSDVVTLSDSSEDEDPAPVCGASPFEKKVTEQLARETAAFANRPAFARKIPVYAWAAAGSRRVPDRKSVRMYLLRTVLAGANRLTEDDHGDIIGLSDAAPSSSRAADAPTPSRTAACSCPHGSQAAECPVCQAADRGRVLKLTLGKKAFEVMVTGEKNEEFRLLEIVDAQGNAAPKNGNRSRLFTGVREPRRGGLLHYDLQSPRVYDYVTFYNAAYFDPRVPNFTCKFISTSLVPHGKTKRYSNGLVVRATSQMAVVKLGPVVHTSPGR